MRGKLCRIGELEQFALASNLPPAKVSFEAHFPNDYFQFVRLIDKDQDLVIGTSTKCDRIRPERTFARNADIATGQFHRPQALIPRGLDGVQRPFDLAGEGPKRIGVKIIRYKADRAQLCFEYGRDHAFLFVFSSNYKFSFAKHNKYLLPLSE